MALQTQFKQTFEVESPIFLLYQTQRLGGNGMNGNLPFEMFEGVSAQVHDGSNSMDIDSAESKDKFRCISYSLETPADEAIGLAEIMQGATAANAVSETIAKEKSDNGTKEESKVDGLAHEEDECKCCDPIVRNKTDIS